MTYPIRSLGILAIALVAVSTASGDPALSFELSDVHPSAPGNAWEIAAMREPVSSARTGQIRGGRYEIHSATLVDLISTAYAVDPAKVIGGPSWLDSARFDVIAKAPAGATAASIPVMLQALLADRFHLRTHFDKQPFPEFVLIAGGHPSLRSTEGGGDSDCKRAGDSADTTVDCRNLTISQFVERLPRLAPDYFQGNPLLDQTHLDGAFDFRLYWTRRSKFATAGSGGIPLAAALEKQLGLILTVHDVPEAVLILDKVDERPTPNLPVIATLLPAPPLAFDVAVIKPTAPETIQKAIRIDPGGRIAIEGMTLKSLVKWAFDIEDLDAIDNEELLTGVPKSAESVRYDVVARAPAIGPADIDSLKLMSRALLNDRFGLRVHTETRTVPVLVMVTSKPRLQHSGARSRSGCRNAPPPPESATASVPIFSVRCNNTTMPQLAAKLQAFGGRYIPLPVIDGTGLTDGFNFTISWSPPHLVSDTAPSDPNGSISLPEALEKQLGLRLKREKHPMQVTVVDHLNLTPTAN